MSRSVPVSGLVLALCAGLWGQSNTGQISGTVYDPSKAVVDAVQVVATNLATNVTQTAASNRDGLYSLPSLSPGTYRVTLEKAGFKKVARGPITVESGSMLNLDFDMTVGSTSSEVMHFGGCADDPEREINDSSTVST